ARRRSTRGRGPPVPGTVHRVLPRLPSVRRHTRGSIARSRPRPATVPSRRVAGPGDNPDGQRRRIRGRRVCRCGWTRPSGSGPNTVTAISIIIAARNAGRTLATTLDSVLAQSHRDWETIIVDDGSTDDTAAVAGGYAAADPRVR